MSLALQPIHRFYATDPLRFSLNVEGDNPGTGWTDAGVAFYAYNGPTAGTVAIHRFYAAGPLRFSLNIVGDNPGTGWTDAGVAFYAYNNPTAGTVAIHQFYAADPWRFSLNVEGDNPGVGWTDAGVVFYAIPTVQWQIMYEDLAYDSIGNPTFEKDVIASREFVNSSTDTVLEDKFIFSITKTSSFEWGLSQNLHTGAKVSFKASVPSLGEAGTEVDVALDLGATQSWNESKAITYGSEQTITVNPMQHVIANGYLDWADDYVVPFRLQIRAYAKYGTMILPSTLALLLFNHDNPNMTDSRAIDGDNAVHAVLKGTFRGSYGLRAYASISPEILALT